jgi:hypothetical protein
VAFLLAIPGLFEKSSDSDFLREMIRFTAFVPFAGIRRTSSACGKNGLLSVHENHGVDGLQGYQGGGENLAAITRQKPIAKTHNRRQIQ